MTTMTRTPAARRSTLDHPTATRLAATEYQRWADALDGITDEQLALPTDNEAWDVRAMAGHVVGMAEMAASPIEQLRQQRAASRAARRSGELFIDQLTDLQVKKHTGDSFDELRDRLRAIGPKAARARRRTPGFLRDRRLRQEQPLPGSHTFEAWTIGYLVDTILTRDPWMHRADLSRATGTPMTLTPDHDGVLVADVVTEWAERHRRPCTLTLTGPAGGTWSFGSTGELLELDAVDFCRIISGRGTGTGLLATFVPF